MAATCSPDGQAAASFQQQADPQALQLFHALVEFSPMDVLERQAHAVARIGE